MNVASGGNDRRLTVDSTFRNEERPSDSSEGRLPCHEIVMGGVFLRAACSNCRGGCTGDECQTYRDDGRHGDSR